MATQKKFVVKNGLIAADLTYPTTDGTENQFLQTDGAGNLSFADASALSFTVKNNTGSTLTKGTAVYVSGLNGNTPEVSLARANSSSTMPAFGLIFEDILDTEDGTVVTFGSLRGMSVADFGESGITFALRDTVYISSSEAGKLTNVAPTGESNLIQNIGKIERATPTTNMTIKIGGAGRSNATPALDDGNIFIGNASNQSSTTTLNTSIVPESTNLYYTAARTDSDAKNAISVTDNGGDGSLTYTESTGVISYTGPSASEVRAHFSQGTGVTISSGQISIGQDVGTSDNVTFADVTISGDLTVSGTTTTVNSTDLTVTDPLIRLADSNTTTDVVDIGFVGQYYDGSKLQATGLFRDANNEEYYLFNTYTDSSIGTATTIDRTDSDFGLATLNINSLKFNDATEQTTAGASPGFAIAMAIAL